MNPVIKQYAASGMLDCSGSTFFHIALCSRDSIDWCPPSVHISASSALEYSCSAKMGSSSSIPVNLQSPWTQEWLLSEKKWDGKLSFAAHLLRSLDNCPVGLDGS